MTSGEIRKEPFYGWSAVVVSFISYMCTFGFIFYGYAVLFPATVKAMGWARGDASIAQTVRALLAIGVAPIVGYLIVRWGVRKTMLSGGVLMFVGTILIATVMDNLWMWTFFWGILVGISFGFIGAVPLQTVATYWFNRYKGTALGIIFTGAAVGGFFGNPLFTWVMREYKSWQAGWIAASVFALAGVLILVFLKNRPEDYGQHKDGISPERAKELDALAAEKKKRALTYRTTHQFTLKEAMKTHQLYNLMFSVLMQYSALVLLVAHGVFHFTDGGLTRMQAAYIISFNLIGGAFARVPVGWLSDRIEGKWLLIFFNLLMFVTMAVIWQSRDVTVLAGAALVFGFAYGAAYTLVPLIVGSYYGPTHFPKIVGWMVPIEYGLGALVPVVAGYVFQTFKSYDNFFVGLLIFLALSVVVAFALMPPKKPA